MAKRLRSLDHTAVDVFEALRRAFIKKGFVRRWPTYEALKNRVDDLPNRAKRKLEGEDAEDRYMAADNPGQVPATHEEAPSPSNGNKPDEDPERLLDITTNAQDMLYQAHSVFPFNMFPDTITIDREKITIANRYFFRVAKINSTPIADLQSVEADVGPFFGTIKVTSKYFINNTREVTFLRRKDVTEIQRLLQGYIIATQREVDCNTIDTDQLKTLLLDLGQGVSD